jgi:IS4 transposase
MPQRKRFRLYLCAANSWAANSWDLRRPRVIYDQSFKAVICSSGSGLVEGLLDARLLFGALVLHSKEVAMVLDEVFGPFIEQSPVSVMFRGTLENVLSADRLDCLFQQTAQKQYCRGLAFSTCTELLGLVVTQIRPSVNAAYRARQEEIAISVQAVYQKLAGIEPNVSETLVRETALDFSEIVDALKARLPGPLPGYEVRIVDGNHLQGTDHRLKELRRIGDAALPGHTLAILNPHRELIEDVVVCQDGHANQKRLFHKVLEKVERRQCWFADRDFSTREFMFGVKRRKAYFLVRQHGALQGEAVGRRKCLGRIDTGTVYEQRLLLTDTDGQQMIVRRITIQLDQPTRDKDTEIHLLTNLPKKVAGQSIAQAYLSRWDIEAAFHKLTMVLRCELNTLGYPQAALFGFCLAVVMYNAVSTVMAALRSAHPEAATEEEQPKPQTGSAKRRRSFSFYYLADEIAGVWRGMGIVVHAEHWSAAFAALTPKQMADELLRLARRVNIKRFLTNPTSNKKRKPPRPIKHGGHISTHKLLQQRTKTAKA